MRILAANREALKDAAEKAVAVQEELYAARATMKTAANQQMIQQLVNAIKQPSAAVADQPGRRSTQQTEAMTIVLRNHFPTKDILFQNSGVSLENLPFLHINSLIQRLAQNSTAVSFANSCTDLHITVADSEALFYHVEEYLRMNK
jgi:hypothetical protein